MNGWGFAAVAVVCVTVLVVLLLWALVRVGQQTAASNGRRDPEVEELSADEEFAAIQAHNRAGQADSRQQIEAAAERARRERDGES